LIFTVALDGPAAAGKGTIARAVAKHFGFVHLDTGTLYRAVGLKVEETGFDPAEVAKGLGAEDLQRDDLRTPKAAQGASKVAAIPEVRTALLQFQRDFARRKGGAILDGRDIGTVICPDADVKLYVTASDVVRAERRYRELAEKGMDVTLDETVYRRSRCPSGSAYKNKNRAGSGLTPALFCLRAPYPWKAT